MYFHSFISTPIHSKKKSIYRKKERNVYTCTYRGYQVKTINKTTVAYFDLPSCYVISKRNLELPKQSPGFQR